MISENLKMTGPNLLSYSDVLPKVIKTTSALINKEHECQQGLDDEDLAGDDLESTELEWLVVDNAMDIISGLAAALGADFGEVWKVFEKRVLRYASGGESLGRASACGVLAEIITGMEDAVTPYTSTILNVLLKRLSDEDPQTKSNAAYAVGRLVEKSNDTNTINKAYPTILQKLENMLGIQEARTMDNAAGCVARLIIKNKDKVPVSDVLPALVNSGVLPLKQDYQENEPVWKMIVGLYRQQDPTVLSLTPKLAPIMMSVLEDDEQLTEETKGQVQALVDHLKSQ